MRARIAGMIVLAGFTALIPSYTPVDDTDVRSAAPRQLTEKEADCLVGGKASCVDVAVNTAESCLDDAGIRGSEIGDNLYNLVVGGICAGSGIWAGATCAWDWLTDLF